MPEKLENNMGPNKSTFTAVDLIVCDFCLSKN